MERAVVEGSELARVEHVGVIDIILRHGDIEPDRTLLANELPGDRFRPEYRLNRKRAVVEWLLRNRLSKTLAAMDHHRARPRIAAFIEYYLATGNVSAYLSLHLQSLTKVRACLVDDDDDKAFSLDAWQKCGAAADMAAHHRLSDLQRIYYEEWDLFLFTATRVGSDSILTMLHTVYRALCNNNTMASKRVILAGLCAADYPDYEAWADLAGHDVARLRQILDCLIEGDREEDIRFFVDDTRDRLALLASALIIGVDDDYAPLPKIGPVFARLVMGRVFSESGAFARIHPRRALACVCAAFSALPPESFRGRWTEIERLIRLCKTSATVDCISPMFATALTTERAVVVSPWLDAIRGQLRDANELAALNGALVAWANVSLRPELVSVIGATQHRELTRVRHTFSSRRSGVGEAQRLSRVVLDADFSVARFCTNVGFDAMFYIRSLLVETRWSPAKWREIIDTDFFRRVQHPLSWLEALPTGDSAYDSIGIEFLAKATDKKSALVLDVYYVFRRSPSVFQQAVAIATDKVGRRKFLKDLLRCFVSVVDSTAPLLPCFPDYVLGVLQLLHRNIRRLPPGELDDIKIELYRWATVTGVARVLAFLASV